MTEHLHILFIKRNWLLFALYDHVMKSLGYVITDRRLLYMLHDYPVKLTDTRSHRGNKLGRSPKVAAKLT